MMWEYICGSTMHEIMVMTTLNFIISMITLTLVLVKSPLKIIDNHVDLK